MILSFLLVVIVNNEVVSTDDMLFRDIKRCSFFAREIERSDNRHTYYYRKNVTAYCIPKMSTEQDKYYD